MTEQQPLKTLCRDKIAEASLTKTELADLKAKAQPAFNPPKPGLSNWQKVACLLLLVGVGLMAHTQWQDYQREQLISAITQAVVDNHLTQPPLDFQVNELQLLDREFSALSFTLVDSMQVPALNEQLLGGRYCTILGRQAAQLRLDQGGRTSSLYQLPFDTDHFGRLGDINVDQRPLLRYARGLEVLLWEEKGVLLALVQAPAAADKPIAAPQLVPPSATAPLATGVIRADTTHTAGTPEDTETSDSKTQQP